MEGVRVVTRYSLFPARLGAHLLCLEELPLFYRSIS